MRNRLLVTVLFCAIALSSYAQKVTNVEFIEFLPKSLAAVYYGKPVKSDVNKYKITYETVDLKGDSTIATGLLCIPAEIEEPMDVIIYGHGTVGDRYSVPSYGSFESNLPAIMASKGLISICADYLGLGDNPGLHPYVHADSEAWTNKDLLLAVQDYLADSETPITNRIFITGYSQGGHTAMALHRYFETVEDHDFEVVLSVPMSGPYSIHGIYDFFINQDEVYDYAGYLVWVILSYEAVYGDIYEDLSDIFVDEAITPIEQYINEEIALGDLTSQLNAYLTETHGANYASRIIRQNVLDKYKDDDDNPLSLAAYDNDVYKWAPSAPTRLYYCQADDQVPFFNSLLALSEMNERGALDVMAVDINSSLDHGACVIPAMKRFMDLLDNYILVSTEDATDTELSFYPNPVDDILYLPENISSIEMYDLYGKRIFSSTTSQSKIDVSAMSKGIYLIRGRVGNENKLTLTQRIIKL